MVRVLEWVWTGYGNGWQMGRLADWLSGVWDNAGLILGLAVCSRPLKVKG